MLDKTRGSYYRAAYPAPRRAQKFYSRLLFLLSKGGCCTAKAFFISRMGSLKPAIDATPSRLVQILPVA